MEIFNIIYSVIVELDVNFVLDFLSNSPYKVYCFIAILMCLNSLIMVPPSEFICLLAGGIALNESYSIIVLVAVASIFNLLGTIPWYVLGRFVTEKNSSRSFCRAIHDRIMNLQIFEDIAFKNSSLNLFVIRNIPLIRSICSYPAGFFKVDLFRFIFFSYFGILSWVSIWIILGYTIINIASRYHILISTLFAITSILFLKFSISKVSTNVYRGRESSGDSIEWR